MAGFPEFADGDVRIVLTTGRQYQLHAGILRLHSRAMRHLLDEAHSADLSSRAVKAGVFTRWKLVLVPVDEYDAALRFTLSPVPLSDRGVELRGSSTTIVVDNENGRVADPLFKSYDSVLRAMYGLPIDLGNAQEDNMTDLLKAALDALLVADYLECVPVVAGPIEATLLATGQSLFRTIAMNPTGWLIFGDRIKSRAIFKEALIHAVGCYNSDKVQKAIHDGVMHDGIVSILDRKSQEVMNGVGTTTRRLACYYPISLTRVATVGRIDKDNTGRADYGNDILGWMALSVFRHWLGDQMGADRTHHSKDMGFFFMQLLNQGGTTYLNRTLMQRQFHSKFPMSPKGMNAVEFRLSEIKDNVKSYVRGYFKATCQLDLARYPVKHYTHINVAPEDFPWHAQQMADKNADIDRIMHGGGEETDEYDEDDNFNDMYDDTGPLEGGFKFDADSEARNHDNSSETQRDHTPRDYEDEWPGEDRPDTDNYGYSEKYDSEYARHG